MSKSITQDMAYRQSLMKYTEKYGVSLGIRKHNKSRSYIYFWEARDGTAASLACRSRRPHSHPGQRVQADVKVVSHRCIADLGLRLYQYTAIDEFIRPRFLAAYPEQSTCSSADFLKKLFNWYARQGIRVECVQRDNSFEFTNRFFNSFPMRPPNDLLPLNSLSNIFYKPTLFLFNSETQNTGNA